MEIEKAKSLDIARLLAFRGLMSGNKLNSVSESRKTLILQGFPGFLFFTGYKLATSGRFFVAIVFCGYHVKLIGYFGLLIRVQMAVGFHGSLYPFMS